MRLWLLCAVAVAMAGVAGADHGDSGMAAERREGQRRPHRPCSGCFSVLSEESQSMPWNSREEDAAQLGRRARSRKGLEARARRESLQPSQPAGHPGRILLL
ncbi:uncharacterized protein LOC144245905 [Lonchura striata]|uniref:Uncharacterized protein n=1 Tax=Lonchura striata TaxID=40157 RepID=A0A218UEM8_9PASE|nr:hypothetical protein RLOC_00001931 [Lonchura striata domestica]